MPIGVAINHISTYLQKHDEKICIVLNVNQYLPGAGLTSRRHVNTHPLKQHLYDSEQSVSLWHVSTQHASSDVTSGTGGQRSVASAVTGASL